jgi:hypothetical protein
LAFEEGKPWRAKAMFELAHVDICGPMRTILFFQCQVFTIAMNLLNRSPTKVGKGVTPIEALSGRKPPVNHFKNCGFVEYVLTPEERDIFGCKMHEYDIYYSLGITTT